MRRQLRRVRRRAMLRQIGRRGDQMRRDIAQPPRTQAAVGQLADAQRHVEPFGDDIHPRVRTMQVDLDARMLFQERREQRRDVADAEAHRRRQPDAPGRYARGIACRFLRRARLAQDARRMVGERSPRLGQRQPARRAVEQRLADMRLQPADRLGDGRLAQPDRIGGAAERAMLHHRGEDRPGFQIRQSHRSPHRLQPPALPKGTA